MTNSIQSHKNENQKITHEEPTKLFNTAEQICDFLQKLEEHKFQMIENKHTDFVSADTIFCYVKTDNCNRFENLLTLIDSIVIDKRLGVKCYFLDIKKTVHLLKDPKHIAPFFKINNVPFLNYKKCDLVTIFLKHYLYRFLDIVFKRHKRDFRIVKPGTNINIRRLEINGTFIILHKFGFYSPNNFNDLLKKELIELHNVFNYFKFNFNFGGFF